MLERDKIIEEPICFNQTLFVAFPSSLFVSDQPLLEASQQQQSNFVPDFQIKNYYSHIRLASLKATLVQKSAVSSTDRLTGVKCKATSVAKNAQN